MFTQKRSIYLNINTKKKSTKSSKRSLKLQDEQQKKIEYFYRKTETYFIRESKPHTTLKSCYHWNFISEANLKK